MAEYITRIRTENGDLQIDYNSLANLPSSDTSLSRSGSFADAKVVGDKINKIIQDIQDGDALSSITINGKKLSTNPVLTASDVGAASIRHEHSASEITSGTLPISRGGIGATNGSEGLKNLLASGVMIVSSNQYGNSLPSGGTVGQIFFVKVQ